MRGGRDVEEEAQSHRFWYFKEGGRQRGRKRKRERERERRSGGRKRSDENLRAATWLMLLLRVVVGSRTDATARGWLGQRLSLSPLHQKKAEHHSCSDGRERSKHFTFSSLWSSLLSSFFSESCSCLCWRSTFSRRTCWGKKTGESQEKRTKNLKCVERRQSLLIRGSV